MRATLHGDVSKFVDMVEAGMLVHIADQFFITTLICAARYNQNDVICCLLGANLDKQGGRGFTALHFASGNNNTDTLGCYCNAEQVEISRMVTVTHQLIMHVGRTTKNQLVYCDNIR